jgi:hypothetical protein
MNDIVSPPPSAYSEMRYSGTPAYGPKGGATDDNCSPRICEPTSAVRVPDVCLTPLMETRAVIVIDPTNAAAENGGGEGKAGGGAGGGGGGGGDGGSSVSRRGEIKLPTAVLV